ncbi:MAG: hypothetical protein BroJett013_07000 [Alphaproteobacteria bacterium]|nr:MAG: hypothetical protein BroJett013_07000 [Alphaproteobacteria bacterium]
MPLLVSEADRLREAFKLTRGETQILVAVLNHDEPAPREAVRGEGNSASFNVMLCKLNKKLPATVHVCPVYENGARFEKGRRLSRSAIGYEISSEWARDQLMRVARPEQSAERAA